MTRYYPQEPEVGQIFDYLSQKNLPTNPEPAVVFGRQDPLVARAVGDLVIPGLVEVAVITGGIGKDSGDLLERGFRSEAAYLRAELEEDGRTRGYTLPAVILEERATNGGENARFSLDKLEQIGYDTPPGLTTVTAITHATSAGRLAETLRFEAAKRRSDEGVPTVHIKPTAYDFDPRNPKDRSEALAELLRLADWPAKGWLFEQPDLPQNLVEFARAQAGKTPPQPSPLAGAVLRILPPRIRVALLKRL